KIADQYNVDITEIIERINKSPRRLMLEPGAGVGGHCIPVYPYFLISTVTNPEDVIPLIKAARKTNESMPEYTVRLAEQELRKKGKNINGSCIVVLGLAFRPYIKEVANSPTISIVKLLKQKGSTVFVYDPLFSKDEIQKITAAETGPLDELLKDADCVIISTMYDEFRNIREKTKSDCVIIDGRNKLREADKGIGR
ncbi:MAG: nucleotide sugar dehydrogenase, partial [Chloroflexi bacterium]